ncbi:hypothetical protein B0H16DRAFT_1807448 [Mycena metata]|uniref:Uncharacterized protein n=1 Tax=Mycena metata TaxID=1033252 RepID=A0AAD7NJB6_9AGAR|nr:hypothetical protein B0H16DRAFT_1807448 [Mycena metata]
MSKCQNQPRPSRLPERPSRLPFPSEAPSLNSLRERAKRCRATTRNEKKDDAPRRITAYKDSASMTVLNKAIIEDAGEGTDIRSPIEAARMRMAEPPREEFNTLTARSVYRRFEAQISGAKSSEFSQGCADKTTRKTLSMSWENRSAEGGEDAKRETRSESNRLIAICRSRGSELCGKPLAGERSHGGGRKEAGDGRFDPSGTATILLLSHHDDLNLGWTYSSKGGAGSFWRTAGTTRRRPFVGLAHGHRRRGGRRTGMGASDGNGISANLGQAVEVLSMCAGESCCIVNGSTSHLSELQR